MEEVSGRGPVGRSLRKRRGSAAVVRPRVRTPKALPLRDSSVKMSFAVSVSWTAPNFSRPNRTALGSLFIWQSLASKTRSCRELPIAGATSPRHFLAAAPSLRSFSHEREVPMTMTRRLALLAPATVALGAAAFSSTPARAAMKTESIDYSHGNTKLKAHVAYDDSVTGKRPAIFMVHARDGLTDFAKQQAEEWSKLGYYVFATDMYGMLPKNLQEITAQTDMFRDARVLMRARPQAGFDVLAKQPLV